MRQHVNVRHERTTPDRSPHRGAYHHGDLRNALSAAGAELARTGGPEAVVLREAARRVGVSPTAAYRHFANHAELLTAVKHEALADLADALAAALAVADAETDGTGFTAQQRALARMKAIGHGYIRFALDNDGLFRTAFCRSDPDSESSEEAKDPPMDLGTERAYQLLSAVLDEMLAAGLIAPTRRVGAEATAWALVHGLAYLLLNGPVRHLPEADRLWMVDNALSTLVGGLATQAEQAG